ncbi:MAG: hypothetical protein H0W83_09740 [Planctomycetes bacterium]|nr:hypothetical protein [Planctomycetota bacterium]
MPALLIAALLAIFININVAAAESRLDQPVLKEAAAMLRVNDGLWIERQASMLIASAGQDAKSVRETIARALYCSASLEGIDLGRPAVVAWRPGRSALTAVIPVANRRVFVDNFGAMPAGEPPLVRVGDRDGTVVLTQNRNGGRDEYRLLVSDNTAYLARTADECRLLAAKPLPQPVDDAVLSFTAWGPFTDRLPYGIPLDLPLVQRWLPAEGTAAAVILQQAGSSLVTQLASWSWQIRHAPNGAQITASLQLLPDSQCAEWLRSQSNQANRLASVVRTPATVAQVSGMFSWQGQCEAFGQSLVPQMKAIAGEHWTLATDAAWHSAWSLFDRTGSFAFARDHAPDGSEGSVAAVEQMQAQILCANIAAIVPVLFDRTVAEAKVGALSGATFASADGKGPVQAVIATERHLIAASGARPPEALAAAGTLAGRTATSVPPAGAVGLMSCWIDLTRWVREEAKERLDPDLPLPQVAIDVVMKAGRDEIVVESVLPLSDIAQLLNKSSGK